MRCSTWAAFSRLPASMLSSHTAATMAAQRPRVTSAAANLVLPDVPRSPRLAADSGAARFSQNCCVRSQARLARPPAYRLSRGVACGWHMGRPASFWRAAAALAPRLLSCRAADHLLLFFASPELSPARGRAALPPAASLPGPSPHCRPCSHVQPSRPSPCDGGAARAPVPPPRFLPLLRPFARAEPGENFSPEAAVLGTIKVGRFTPTSRPSDGPFQMVVFLTGYEVDPIQARVGCEALRAEGSPAQWSNSGKTSLVINMNHTLTGNAPHGLEPAREPPDHGAGWRSGSSAHWRRESVGVSQPQGRHCGTELRAEAVPAVRDATCSSTPPCVLMHVRLECARRVCMGSASDAACEACLTPLRRTRLHLSTTRPLSNFNDKHVGTLPLVSRLPWDRRAAPINSNPRSRRNCSYACPLTAIASPLQRASEPCPHPGEPQCLTTTYCRSRRGRSRLGCSSVRVEPERPRHQHEADRSVLRRGCDHRRSRDGVLRRQQGTRFACGVLSC